MIIIEGEACYMMLQTYGIYTQHLIYFSNQVLQAGLPIESRGKVTSVKIEKINFCIDP